MPRLPTTKSREQPAGRFCRRRRRCSEGVVHAPRPGPETAARRLESSSDGFEAGIDPCSARRPRRSSDYQARFLYDPLKGVCMNDRGSYRLLPPIAGGERTVEAFASVRSEHRGYLFLFVDWSLEAGSGNSDDPVLRNFGRALTDRSSLVRAYDAYSAYNEVISKPWSHEDREAILGHGPFLLIINRSFAEFEPGRDPFAFVWLEDFKVDGGARNDEELGLVLRRIADLARNPSRDIFDSVRALAERSRSASSPALDSFFGRARPGSQPSATETAHNDTT